MLRLQNLIAVVALGCFTATSAFAGTIMPPTSYSLSFDVTNLSYAVNDLYLFSSFGSSLAISPNSADATPPSETLNGGTYFSEPAHVLLIGVANFNSANHLVLFANTSFAGTQSDPNSGSAVDQNFDTLFTTDEGTLITDILTGGSNLIGLDMFAASIINSDGFGPNDPFGIIAFSGGTNIGGGQSDFVATPLPASWTALLLGFIAFGLILYRQQSAASA